MSLFTTSYILRRVSAVTSSSSKQHTIGKVYVETYMKKSHLCEWPLHTEWRHWTLFSPLSHIPHTNKVILNLATCVIVLTIIQFIWHISQTIQHLTDFYQKYFQCKPRKSKDTNIILNDKLSTLTGDTLIKPQSHMSFNTGIIKQDVFRRKLKY